MPRGKKQKESSLVEQRNSVEASILRIYELILHSGKSFSAEELDCRLEIIETYFQRALELQSSIEEGSFVAEESNDKRATLEDIYCKVKVLIRSMMRQKLAVSDVKKTQPTTSKSVPENLPKLKLPIFAGKYSDFPNFIRLFRTLVHNEERLSVIEKFNHLLSCVSGPALQTIQGLDITEENYEAALQLLEARFDNKYLICQEHIRQLFNLNKVQKGSPEQLRALIDTVTARFNALKSLLNYEEITNALIGHLVVAALDNESQAKIEEIIDCNTTFNWSECSGHLSQRCQILESRASRPNVNECLSTKFGNSKQGVKSTRALALPVASNYCKCCNKNEIHAMWKCPRFAILSPIQRFEEAKRLSLCINCLSSQHLVRQCKSSACKYCNAYHHSMLHRGSVNQNSTSSSSKQPQQQQQHQHQQHQLQQTQQRNLLQQDQNQLVAPQSSSELTQHNWSTAMVTDVENSQPQLDQQIILATAVIKILDKYGNWHFARALLDSGSQLNFISRALAQRLSLDFNKTHMVIGGIGESYTNSNFCTNTQIASRTSEFSAHLCFLILNNITGHQPDCEININEWNIPQTMQLADNRFNVPHKIDLLIGAETFFALFDGQFHRLGPNLPTLIHTKFGWIVSGRCLMGGTSSHSLMSSYIQPAQTLQLEGLVKLFWDMECVPNVAACMSQEHAQCEAHFIKHVQRDDDGRFMVKLPFKGDISELGDSKTMAVRRFYGLEKRLNADQQIKQAYSEFLKQYETDGHSERVPWPRQTADRYFMPHHCVLRPEKSTTKCRVVFDASAKTSSHISLNDKLMSGPVVQRELYNILLRFRLHKFALMADITAMYRQIRVYPEDYKFQNIVWRSSPDEDLQLYILKTVTYGTTSAPFLATRCLVKLADDNMKYHAEAATIVKNDFYVDDLITGGDSLETIERIKQNVTKMLSQAKFRLCKWHSNHKQFLNSIPEAERERPIKFCDSEVVKALGIIWDSSSDCFKFKYTNCAEDDSVITKRKVLSQLARLFDPLGLVNPIVVKAKVFFQELWLKDLEWDEPIDPELADLWLQYLRQLLNINNIKIPRFVLIENSLIQLHGFSDASSRAYGCCFYIRCIDASGNTKVHLYTAKSKVAPIKLVRSMPCLELCAAHLMVQLYVKIYSTLPKHEAMFWSDSVIVLSWLAQHSSNYNTFVANRVSFIQENAEGIKWRYVNSECNPADIVSRGASVDELQSSIWFEGPQFLHQDDSAFPTQPSRLKSTELPERKIQKTILVACNKNTTLDFVYSCSDFMKICRCFAYIRRFVKNVRNTAHRNSSHQLQLTAKEIDDAFLNIIYMVQQEHYSSETKSISQGKALSTSNLLTSLNPFLEEVSGFVLLKVGGRLRNSDLPYEAKCPIILPKANFFIQCYVRYLHLSNLHAGAQALVNIIRKRFWIIGARDYARKIVRKCVHCFKYKPKLSSQLMGQLPRERVHPMKPFTYSGVDFCGPIITTWRQRGKPKYKTYIAVFVCFTTHAVHLEVVSNLTSDAFIAALKRFVARRGLCKTLHMDNATNFVGARNQLKEFRNSFLNEQVQGQLTSWCASHQIDFKHIPPRSPHFGGLWEAAVKSAKTILYKAMQSAILTFEELTTVVTQIEGILNSRPITALSTSPNDEEALTPAHFLGISVPETLIEPPSDFKKISSLKNWRQITALQQHFWARWSKEYLVMLQQRRKWDRQIPNLAPGALVMIHDDNLPPQKWLIGRITQVYKGSDEKVRVAEVKTPAGLLKRAIVKLAVLPIEDHVEPR